MNRSRASRRSWSGISGFKANFREAKLELEKGDGAGNTFKATAKPVLIGTAVVGATTMIFGIIMLLQNVSGHAIENLSMVQPQMIFGLLMGGAVIYWFTGASMQAVVTGAYSAVVFIKKNLKFDTETASVADSKRVVEICTVYAQRGLINIFVVVFAFALGLPFFNPYFFIGYLIGIAFFGLFQAIFMANAGGAWDNAKKIVEVDLKMKGTPLHAATVVGDTVGDPFKDTSSVAMNPIIKFTTLFGLLAVEIAVKLRQEHPDSNLVLCRLAGRVSWSPSFSSIVRFITCGFPPILRMSVKGRRSPELQIKLEIHARDSRLEFVSVIEHSFQASWRLRVFFTENVFAPANPLSKCTGGHTPRKVLILLDQAVTAAQPGLPAEWRPIFPRDRETAAGLSAGNFARG